MVDQKGNEIKTISWFLVAKNLIKFTDGEATYSLSDKVKAVSNFEKFPLKKGDRVEVGLKDGIITYLRKQKSEPNGSEEAYEPTPAEEAPKVEEKVVIEPAKVVGELKELTVFAVATNKKVVKFLENKDEGWFNIDPSIQAMDYATIGLVAKSKVKVQISEKTVISLQKVAVESSQPTQDKPSEATVAKVEPTVTKQTTAQLQQQIAPLQAPVATPTVKKEWKPASSYDTAEKQLSIEAQAMINSACQVVGRVAASISPAPTANIINAMIRVVAEENYKLLQELKKK
jgi:hypothetical protein